MFKRTLATVRHLATFLGGVFVAIGDDNTDTWDPEPIQTVSTDYLEDEITRTELEQ